jgi:uncharacterized protein
LNNVEGYIDASMPEGFNSNDVTPPFLTKSKWLVTSLALDLSGTCNLSCRYCAERASQPERSPMNMDVLDAAINYIFPEGKMKYNTTIRIGSGEPLMALPLLKEIERRLILISLKKTPQLNDVFITTNGTLIDDEALKWLLSTSWHIKISFDGPKVIHDHWRVTNDNRGTYDKIKPIIQVLAKEKQRKFSTTSVLCKGADPQKVFDEAAGMGVQRIELVPVAHHDKENYPENDDIEKYIEFVQNYSKTFEKRTDNEQIPTLTRFSDSVCRVMGYKNSRIACGAGRNFFGVGPDGLLYPCFRFIGIKEYVLGSVFSGLNNKAVSVFMNNAGRPYEERTSCKRCWAAPLCGGPCFACSEIFGPGNGEPLAIHCAYMIANAKAAISLVNTLRKTNPEHLLSFLPEIVRFV